MSCIRFLQYTILGIRILCPKVIIVVSAAIVRFQIKVCLTAPTVGSNELSMMHYFKVLGMLSNSDFFYGNRKFFIFLSK
jgi:hypothetical protein